MATANPVATELMVATDISYDTLVKHYNGAYATQLPTTAGELTKGVQLYSKMRHEDDVMGWSDWSTDVTFQIAQYYKWFLELRCIAVANNLYLAKALAITSDGDSNIYVGGYRQGIWGAYTYNVPTLIKIDKTGTFLWEYYLGVSSGGQPVTIVDLGCDNLGNVFAISNITNTNPYDSSPDSKSSFIFRTSPDGPSDTNWRTGLTTTDMTAALNYNSIDVDDNDGSITVIGHVTIDETVRPVIMNISTGGLFNYQKYINSQYTLGVSKITHDSASNKYISGYITVNSTLYPVIIKVSNTGQILWSRYLTNMKGTAASSIALDSNNNIYMLVGSATNVTVVALTESGVFKWQKALPVSYYNNLSVIKDAIYIVGMWSRTTGHNDPIILKLDLSSGELVWNAYLEDTRIGYDSSYFTDVTGLDNGAVAATGYHSYYTDDHLTTSITEIITTSFSPNGISSGSLIGTPTLSWGSRTLSELEDGTVSLASLLLTVVDTVDACSTTISNSNLGSLSSTTFQSTKSNM